jgi:hypothetical protein
LLPGQLRETKDKWLATLRGRLGFAADRVLFYATGGGAFGDVLANTTSNWQSDNKAAAGPLAPALRPL